jgi:hypothetical protein
MLLEIIHLIYLVKNQIINNTTAIPNHKNTCLFLLIQTILSFYFSTTPRRKSFEDKDEYKGKMWIPLFSLFSCEK